MWEDRGGQDLLKKYDSTRTIPFHAIVSPAGKKLGGSEIGAVNMGVPGNLGKVQAFITLIHKTAPQINDRDLDQVRASRKHYAIIE